MNDSWIITKTRQEVNEMTISLWTTLCEYPNRWDINRDTITWQIPQEQYCWILLKYPELQKERK